MSGSTGAVSASHSGASDVFSIEHGSGAGTALQSDTDGRIMPMASDWPRCSSLELAAERTVVRSARLYAKRVRWEWQLDHLVDDAVTLVSELITNAIEASWATAGANAVALRLLANDEQLLIEVWDQSLDEPRPRAVDDEAESGRGLAVIEALSHGWGWRRVSLELKVVWCEVGIKRL